VKVDFTKVLHLHLLRLNLCVKQQTTPLDPVDIQSVYDLQTKYLNTFGEMETDYIGLCKTLFDKYPLMSQSMYADRGRTDVVPIYNPNPVEGLALADYAINKWLAGDRMLMVKAANQLQTLQLT
jgi:hypothetical protein